MGSHENGDTFGGKLVNEIPETAAGYRIHTRGRFIQKNNRRFMQQSAAKRQPLPPTACQKGGQAVPVFGESGHFDHPFLPRGFLIGRNLINSAVEIDVFFDGEIFIERELLRHVADM